LLAFEGLVQVADAAPGVVVREDVSVSDKVGAVEENVRSGVEFVAEGAEV